MAYQVTFSPSGRQILVDSGETILEAALRAGVAVDYHCENGTCGDCRARIVEGDTGLCLHHDYSFRGADKSRPMLLMCRTHPASDMVIEAQEASSWQDIPLQKIQTAVTMVERNQPDVLILHLRTPRSQTLRFFAGQYLAMEIAGFEPIYKSIASCPCNGRDLQFHFSRLVGDSFSDYVFGYLKKRDTVTIEGPHGDFVLDEQSSRPIILIAHETGFAPIKSLVEHIIALEVSQPIQLYWVTRHDKGHYLENYCRAWKDALDNFSYTLIRDEGSDTMGDSFLENALAANNPVFDNLDVYATGSAMIIKGLRRFLEKRGAVPGQLHFNAIECIDIDERSKD
jgi:CDP-4-dehydro-6-deoxyglucose reductase